MGDIPGLVNAEGTAKTEASGGEDGVAALLRIVDAIPEEVYAASGMVCVDPEQRVTGRAFVPVGCGHAPDVPFPLGGVLVLGQDFGSEQNLDDVVAAGEETDEAVPTWRESVKALSEAAIPIEACWFTNYVMGVRRGRESNCKRRSPGLRRGDLRSACARLFPLQLGAQRPCAIVVLGTHLPPVLASDFPSVFGVWRGGSFPRRDLDDGAALREVQMGDVTVPLVISILHPSLRGPNLHRRRFAGRAGAEAERVLLGMVRDVVRERWTPRTPTRASGSAAVNGRTDVL
jgi:hypothetical protein